MAKDIEQYVATCDICQRMKAPRHKPYGLLAALPQPEAPLDDISMDFIVGLPPSERHGKVYNSIWVIVDRFSKLTRFIPCNSTVTSEQLGNMFMDC